ncbi:hypothetical protein [Salmonirosea aquatica]|uniref:Trimeric autotransporter adhesin YadA-like head domain-containing protein n=1 Tax=Salmonirosea aquatica TaxID=2654236 RepID=A0A7C9FQL2_9BACT|nr:hypothetical protein [Cytophagaceae bacterium SJW1-29]MPR37123.1 hypothetical protein [Cytophagaceae bacterium SJW1-29]
MGYLAGNANTTGNTNTFIGYHAGLSNTTGNSNIVLGYQAGLSSTTGSNNVFLGVHAGYFVTTGGNNLFLGRQAGRYIADGTTVLSNPANSLFLGYNTKALADGQTNQIVIGHDATGLGNNTTVLGNSSTTFTRLFGNVGIGTSTNAGYGLDVNGTGRFTGLTTFQAGTEHTTAGAGIILKTPDGTKRYKITIDNSGNLITTLQ